MTIHTHTHTHTPTHACIHSITYTRTNMCGLLLSFYSYSVNCCVLPDIHVCLIINEDTIQYNTTHTFIQTNKHTYIHTYIHTCMHACMHTYIHTYIHTY